jgi:ankyrin repeat protein
MNSIDRETAKESNLPEVRRLLSVGADVNAKGSGDWTPLHWACYNVHLQVVKKLLDHGADMNAKDNNGNTLCTSRAGMAIRPL